MIGNSTRDRPTVRSTSSLLNLGPMKIGMIRPAARMKNATSAPSAISMIQNSVEASLRASLRLPFCSRSVNTGTNAADSADWANSWATKFGTRLAIVNADAGPWVPK